MTIVLLGTWFPTKLPGNRLDSESQWKYKKLKKKKKENRSFYFLEYNLLIHLKHPKIFKG